MHKLFFAKVARFEEVARVAIIATTIIAVIIIAAKRRSRINVVKKARTQKGKQQKQSGKAKRQIHIATFKLASELKDQCSQAPSDRKLKNNCF